MSSTRDAATIAARPGFLRDPGGHRNTIESEPERR